ncbi:MAG: DUF4129 domain-containing protein [Deltaproteobacteria bacterium]|nr:MAG: DUF4129 domain-containing protein [Deltaproteobacteria bacterium]
MKEALASLRPRGVLALADAALEAVATSPGLISLSLAGAVPLVVFALLLIHGAADGWMTEGVATGLALGGAAAISWRFVASGAVAAFVEASALGRPLAPAAALRLALGRAPSLVAAGALVLLAYLFGLPFLLVPLVVTPGAFVAAPLVMARVRAPWAVLSPTIPLLRDRAPALSMLTALWLGALGALGVNLGLGVVYGLELARALFDVEVGFLATLLSPQNPVYVPSLLAVAFVLLEPFRQASVALAYLDARVRHEGADLLAALEALPPLRRRGAGLGVLLAVGAGLWAAPAAAAPPGRADAKARILRVADELLPPEAVAPWSKAMRQLPDGPEWEAFAGQLERDLAAGATERAKRRLTLAREALQRLLTTAAPQVPSAEAARRRAERILHRPEFARMRRPPAGHAKVEPPKSLWARFLEWLAQWLDGRSEDEEADFDPAPIGGPPRALAWLAWAAFLIAFLGGLGAALLRFLGHRDSAGSADPDLEVVRTEPIVASKVPELASALAQSPEAWLADANRLAEAGRLREAVRAVYLALLATLHRRRAIDYQRSRSNWDLVRGYRGPDAIRTLFAELTRHFEATWYGPLDPRRDDYDRMRRQTLSVADGGDPVRGVPA